MRRVFVLGGVATANVLLSFAYQWYVFTRLGPGRETDALFAAMVLPQLVLAVVSGSLAHVLVPLLSSHDRRAFEHDAWLFFQGIGFLFTALAVVLAISAPLWVPLTVPGFESAAQELTVRLVRIQLIGMVFTASTGVLWAAYHARQRFVWAEVSPVITAALVFPFLVWALPRFGVVAAAWALVAKLGLQTLMLLPGIGKYQRPDLDTDLVRTAWSRLRPLLLGTTFYKTDQLVDRFLASMAPAGALSLLHLGTQLYGAGHQVLNTAIAAPMVPQLARRATAEDWATFRATSRRHLMYMAGLTSLVLAAFVLFGRPVLSLLFGHGRFSPSEVNGLWVIMLALGGTWVGGAMGQILSTSFYAKGDTTTPTKVGVVGYILGIPLKVGGFLLFGVVGIAAGTSIYVLLNALVMSVLLRRHLGRHRLSSSTESSHAVYAARSGA